VSIVSTEQFASIFQAAGGGKRATVLQPLLIALATLGAVELWAIKLAAPLWVLVVLMSAIGAILLVLLFFFIYFAFKDPNRLQSESFNLRKMEMEYRFYGDSLLGEHRVAVYGGTPLPTSTAPALTESTEESSS
jgi:hypothetical protein